MSEYLQKGREGEIKYFRHCTYSTNFKRPKFPSKSSLSLKKAQVVLTCSTEVIVLSNKQQC